MNLCQSIGTSFSSCCNVSSVIISDMIEHLLKSPNLLVESTIEDADSRIFPGASSSKSWTFLWSFLNGSCRCIGSTIGASSGETSDLSGVWWENAEVAWQGLSGNGRGVRVKDQLLNVIFTAHVPRFLHEKAEILQILSLKAAADSAWKT